MKYVSSFILFLLTISSISQENKLPEGFVYAKEIIPDIELEIRYSGENNFIGKPVTGYNEEVAILTIPAAKALYKVQQDLRNSGYCLKIFDAYRPQRAVNQFVAWAREEGDTLKKQEFYPEVPKRELFSRGYIASRSGHSRGSTVDLTMVDSKTGEELDMGGNYDFFGERSHHDAAGISEEQKKNREMLKQAMRKHGFLAYPQEWWHYSYRPEPYPNTYFDFLVE